MVILKLLDPDPESASLMRIRILIQGGHLNADLCGSGYETLVKEQRTGDSVRGSNSFKRLKLFHVDDDVVMNTKSVQRHGPIPLPID